MPFSTLHNMVIELMRARCVSARCWNDRMSRQCAIYADRRNAVCSAALEKIMSLINLLGPSIGAEGVACWWWAHATHWNLLAEGRLFYHSIACEHFSPLSVEYKIWASRPGRDSHLNSAQPWFVWILRGNGTHSNYTALSAIWPNGYDLAECV